MVQDGPIQKCGPEIRLRAYIKPDAIPFLQEHGCVIEPQTFCGDVVIFPAGSRRERMTATSRWCNNIVLPDQTTITVVESYTHAILLWVDLHGNRAIHLTQ